MATPRIGAEEKEHYQKHGFVVVRDLFDAESLDVWKERLRAIIEGEIEPAEHMLVMRDVMVAKGAVKQRTRSEEIAKLQDFENDPVLFGYSTDPRVLDCVEALIGPDLFTLHTMLINKPPNVDGRHPLHQDIIYFPYRPADKIVGTWTALERATKENGCLVGIPGTHTMEIAPHENPDWEYVNFGYFGIKGMGPDPRRVHFELEPGDTVFFHPHLVHGSGRNRSQGFRRSILTHYASTECERNDAIAKAMPQRYYQPVRGRRPHQ